MTESIIKYFIAFLKTQNVDNMENIVRELNSDKTIKELSELMSDKKVGDKKEKKGKKIKDENAPKRPKNSYMFYCEKMRQTLKEENPDMNMIEITKLIGVEWKKLSDEEKNEFQDKASTDKKRYEEQNKSYIRPSDDELVEKKASKKRTVKKKKADGPKKPMSAYIYFCMEKRNEIKDESPDMSAVEVTRELGRLWKEDYSQEESRKKWIDIAEQDKKRYKDESGSEEKESDKEKPNENSDNEKQKKDKSDKNKSDKEEKDKSEKDKAKQKEKSDKEEKDKSHKDNDKLKGKQPIKSIDLPKSFNKKVSENDSSSDSSSDDSNHEEPPKKRASKQKQKK
jgi:hypothetical protein